MSLSQREQIAGLFNQYREKDISGVRFSVLFFFRRFIVLLILIILPTWMNAQLNSQIVLALMVTAFTVHYMPYVSKSQSKKEALNEWTVLVASYHLYMFTSWIYDEERRVELGWSLIILIILNVIFNLSLAGFVAI